MGREIADALSGSISTAIIDSSIASTEEYRPTLIFNDCENKVKVATTLFSELDKCDSFFFSVAFITMSGLSLFYQRFKEAMTRGVKGRIITTDYLNFTEPEAFRWLLHNTNFEVRVYENESFHTKGYIFERNELSTLIIGSSNFTGTALSKNKEWNLKIQSLENGSLLKETKSEFEKMWSDAIVLTDDWIREYEPRHKRSKMELSREIFSPEKNGVVAPNKMQCEALLNLDRLRKEGKDKGLLISSTGTGKTFLSAFDVKEFNAKKMLFLVHREQILKDARDSYSEIFGSKIKYGLLTGNSKDLDVDFLFSTIQTMSKDSTLKRFEPDYFDYIVCDEAHHICTGTYEKILDHFRPKFLLGMTATPERMDAGDVFKSFDYNVAYEIRLQDAMEQDMLCPFHYFGISDLMVDGESIDDKTKFSMLTSDERVKHILEKAEYFSHSGDRVKGLVFCRSVEEANALSEKMNKKGYRTIALSAKNTPEEREKAADRLEMDAGDDCLDYILTFDVFNEGIDIPKVNQILMLRPTQSSIVFIQQLGRGLRKAKNKDFVTVIDFIGNYENNFLIPIALSGDRTCNKDNVRKYLMTGNNLIPGCSSIDFDKISKDSIFEHINSVKLSKFSAMKNEYVGLGLRLGRDPSLSDLYKGGSLDPRVVVDEYDNLYKFRLKIKSDTVSHIDDKKSEMLSFISKQFVNGKRSQELTILKKVIDVGEIDIDDLTAAYSEKSIRSAISFLTGGFLTSVEVKSFSHRNFIVEDEGKLRIDPIFEEHLADTEFKSYIDDAIECGELIFDKEYGGKCDELGFVPFSKYSRKDVCRILNWKDNEMGTINGYRVKYNSCPIFVSYNKSDDISETTKYDDRFIDRDNFSWITRSNIRPESKEVVAISKYRETKMAIPLFVKKEDGEGTDFYYLGQVDPQIDNMHKVETGGKPCVNIPLKLRTTVREDIYDYLTAS